MKKVIGILMILSVFVGIFIYLSIEYGIEIVIKAFAIAIVAMLIIGIGSYLLTDGK